MVNYDPTSNFCFIQTIISFCSKHMDVFKAKITIFNLYRIPDIASGINVLISGTLYVFIDHINFFSLNS